MADVTIINHDYTGRKTPNPNVMLELGYAIKALGWQRILLSLIFLRQSVF